MAVVAIEGFDLYNGNGTAVGLTSPNAWIGINWFYAPGLGGGRFGGQCYFWVNESSESGWPIPVTGPKFTVACAFRHSNIPGVGSAKGNAITALAMCSGGAFAGSNRMLGWRPNPDGTISVFRMTGTNTGTLLGSSAAAVFLSNVWHYVEMSGTLNTVTGAVTVKVDGVTVITLTNVNTCGVAASTSFDGITIGSANGGISGGNTVSFDDMYVLDTDVSLGERRIEAIRPNADTATAQWVPDTGTVHYSRVNATLAQSSSYVKSNVVGNVDLYDTLDLSSTPTYIDYVQITAWMQKSDAGARSVGLIADVGGTQVQSADKPLTASLVRYFHGMSVKPGGAAWDSSSVNSLRIGPKVTV